MSGDTLPAPLSTEEVAERAGATYRQIYHWVRSDYLHPEGGHPEGAGSNGHPWEWPEAEVEVACRMARLVAAGLTVERAAGIARLGRGEFELAPGVVLAVADG